jgi:hypothetical protein
MHQAEAKIDVTLGAIGTAMGKSLLEHVQHLARWLEASGQHEPRDAAHQSRSLWITRSNKEM